MPAERLYYADSDLLTFTARVTDVREYARRDGRQVWQLALDRTAFYPTSGGQPHDTGTVTARARSGASLCLPIKDVTEGSDGEVWHTTGKPLPEGTEVEAAIDAARRRDHTQQHSGQHLLSAILADHFGASTVSFHLGANDTTIDLAVETADAQALLLARLPEVEQRVNAAIAANLPVSCRAVSPAEAQVLLAQGRLRKLPPIEGPVRLVEMAGVDLNACGGTHVAALGQVGMVLLRETERVKRLLRLHFVCGQRASGAARADWEQLSSAAAQLSVGRDGVAPAVARQAAELRGYQKERLRLLEELTAAHAEALLRTASGGCSRLIVHRLDGRDAAYMRLLASSLMRAPSGIAVVLVAPAGETGLILLAANLPLPGGCGGVLREALIQHGLRGGGSSELAQAQVPAAVLEPVAEALGAAIRAALTVAA